MRIALKKNLKIYKNYLLAAGAIAGSITAIYGLIAIFIPEGVEAYDLPYIPLVYSDVTAFNEFLEENAGKEVYFDTQISLDMAMGINHLIHEVCNFDELFIAINEAPEKVEDIDIPLARFLPGFVDPESNYTYNSETGGHNFSPESTNNLLCIDSLRIKLKDPERLRFSHGGTGVISLPFRGRFLIERRFFSGPSTEYTLLEI